MRGQSNFLSFQKPRLCRKKVDKAEALFSSSFQKNLLASLTIEAAFSLSLFLFAIIILMTPLFILNREIRISREMEKNARILCMAKYLEHYGLKKTDIADIEHIDQILEISETALEDILLPNTIPTEGMENIQSFRSHITEEDIYLNLQYDEPIPFGLLQKKNMRQEIVAHRRAWIGSKGARWEKEENAEEENEEEMVYVIDGPSKVYHLSSDCTYISNDFLSCSARRIDGTNAKYGGKFCPCKACHPDPNSPVVYYTEAGRRYHSTTDCPAMRSSVHKIPLKQALAEGRHPCPRCGK